MAGSWVEITLRAWIEWPDEEGEADAAADELDFHMLEALQAFRLTASGSPSLRDVRDLPEEEVLGY